MHADDVLRTLSVALIVAALFLYDPTSRSMSIPATILLLLGIGGEIGSIVYLYFFVIPRR